MIGRLTPRVLCSLLADRPPGPLAAFTAARALCRRCGTSIEPLENGSWYTARFGDNGGQILGEHRVCPELGVAG